MMKEDKFLKILYVIIIIALIYHFALKDKLNLNFLNNDLNVDNEKISSILKSEDVNNSENDRTFEKENSQTGERQPYQNYDENSEVVNVTVNYPINLSSKSKNAIFNLRKHYVSKSIFANPLYNPSDYVFGQIEDYKPWMSVNICKSPSDSAKNDYEPSEESRFIVNPTMLVAVEYPFYNINLKKEACMSQDVIFLPEQIFYKKAKKEITVVYKNLPIIIENNSFYQFNGINAKDLGYKYFYIDKAKSTFDIPFTSSNNPTNEIFEFQNFIHLGSSCGLPQGCNNGSPRQPALEFTYKKYQNKQNAVIYMKLWKNYPESVNSPADIYEKIIFQNV